MFTEIVIEIFSPCSVAQLPTDTVPPSLVAQSPVGTVTPSSMVQPPAGLPPGSVAMPSDSGEHLNTARVSRQDTSYTQDPPTHAKPAPVVADTPNPSQVPAVPTSAPSSRSSREQPTDGSVDQTSQVTAARSHCVEPSRRRGGSQQTSSWRGGWRQRSVDRRTAVSSEEQRGRREGTGDGREPLLLVRRY